jgi:polyribonucleotide nucleotidyltransferase
MAAVCGSTLSLMDSGTPISAPVAGVAMGLIKEGDKFIVLTDILGDEDALGDMDFKIAGSAEGISAVQMDIKIKGLTTEIMSRAMAQAKEARLHILGEMTRAIAEPRGELSPYAPQHAEIFVNPEIIRMIIGPGGKNIKAITTATGASIDIDDSGRISLFAPTLEAMQRARDMVCYYDQRPDLGANYTGKVRKLLEIGCIVEIMPNVEALVHISQLDLKRVEKVEDIVRLGDEIPVKVIEISGDRIRASRKAVLLEEQGTPWNPEDTARPPRGDRKDRGGRERGGRDHHRDRNE